MNNLSKSVSGLFLAMALNSMAFAGSEVVVVDNKNQITYKYEEGNFSGKIKARCLTFEEASENTDVKYYYKTIASEGLIKDLHNAAHWVAYHNKTSIDVVNTGRRHSTHKYYFRSVDVDKWLSKCESIFSADRKVHEEKVQRAKNLKEKEEKKKAQERQVRQKELDEKLKQEKLIARAQWEEQQRLKALEPKYWSLLAVKSSVVDIYDRHLALTTDNYLVIEMHIDGCSFNGQKFPESISPTLTVNSVKYKTITFCYDGANKRAFIVPINNKKFLKHAVKDNYITVVDSDDGYGESIYGITGMLETYQHNLNYYKNN